VGGRTNGGLSFNAATNNQRALVDDSAGKLNFGAKSNLAFSIISARWTGSFICALATG
jgi:hypothetical protein